MEPRKGIESGDPIEMVVRGIHHIGVAVRDLPEALSRWTSLLGAAAGPGEDIEASMAEMRGQGLVFVSDTPRPGAGGSLTAFVHPRSFDGVLLELRQSSSSGPTETV